MRSHHDRVEAAELLRLVAGLPLGNAPRAGERSPPDRVLDSAFLLRRMQPARPVELARLAAELGVPAERLAEGLVASGHAVAVDAVGLGEVVPKWPRVFIHAAALGTSDSETRLTAMRLQAELSLYGWDQLPACDVTTSYVRHLVGPLFNADPDLAVRLVGPLVLSPDLLRAALERLQDRVASTDPSRFLWIISHLSLCRCFRVLAFEPPVDAFVRAVVRRALEHTGDAGMAAAGLDLLVCGNPSPQAEDLALAAAVAARIRAAAPGWRAGALRPVLIEAAAHGARGCLEAALRLTG
ncbi:MAG: hypothetical protein KC776_19055 [Myxococcales bacterium]|nr:hypothetical protein [Myxococcales bacterium]MCB9576656.1 hypothetical protein [Polyangiaceae bacterium]